MLVAFHHLLLFWFSIFYTLKLLTHYFQFVNFTHLFQPSYLSLEGPEELEYSADEMLDRASCW